MRKPMDKRRQWILLALVLVGLPAVVLGICSIYWNFILLPPFEQRGIQTRAEIVEISVHSDAKNYTRTLVVEHQPAGSDTRYRHWISGLRANEITRSTRPGVEWHAVPTDDADRWVAAPKEVGDRIRIIYLPDEPHSRAVLPLDFKARHQAPMNRLDYAGVLWAVWLLLFAIFKALKPQ